jgi:hypothetical protein
MQPRFPYFPEQSRIFCEESDFKMPNFLATWPSIPQVAAKA